MAKKKKAKGNFFHSPLVTLVLCAALLWIVVSICRQQSQITGEVARGKSLNTEIQTQQEEKTRIENQLKTQNTEERVEQIAREELDMVKPNERVFVDASR